MKGAETATVKAILQFLALHRIPAWRMNTGGAKVGTRFVRFGAVGMSDIIGVLPLIPGSEYSRGRLIAIEAKSAKGIVTKAQLAFLDTVNAAGGLAFVARSVEDVRLRLGLP